MFYVYELRDAAGVPFYIGKGSKRRMHQHEIHARAGKKSHTCDKIRKIWKAGQQITKAIVFSSPEESAAFAEEIRLIAYYGRGTLTNKTDGGDGVRNLAQESRERIAASRRGKIASEATRNRQRLAKLGARHTPETKAKIAAKQRTIKKPWARKSGANLGSGFAGKKWSAEHRAKFIAARIGHKVSKATRRKISRSKKLAGIQPRPRKPKRR